MAETDRTASALISPWGLTDIYCDYSSSGTEPEDCDPRVKGQRTCVRKDRRVGRVCVRISPGQVKGGGHSWTLPNSATH